MEEPESPKRKLTKAQSKRARARWVRISTVTKAITQFKDCSHNSLLTRRRNLVAHLGVDEGVGSKEVQEINLLALPVPVSILISPERLSKCFRYVFLKQFNV